jgi:RNA-directed DNA polymerase
MSLEPDRVERLRKKLYEKAKREPDYRFYTLYDKVCWPETLAQAYRQAKANAGAPGVDGVRFEDIEAYGVDRWLAELRQELVDETYHPQPVRRVMIPKPGGGERPLGIPTIRDRVAQTAVVLILEPIFEADFEDNAYAYRPERSAHDALAEVRKRLYGGQEHVVDADVSQYFDTIPHAELLQSVARRVADGKILRLLKLWLKSPVEEKDERGNRRMTGGKKSKRGTPQGGVVSPLLANVYINRLLRHWRKTGASERLGQIVSYADDFVILCASRRQAEESLALVSRWLEKLGLTIHPTKTRLCHAREEPFDFLATPSVRSGTGKPGINSSAPGPRRRPRRGSRRRSTPCCSGVTPPRGRNCETGSTDSCWDGPNTSASASQAKRMMPSAGTCWNGSDDSSVGGISCASAERDASATPRCLGKRGWSISSRCACDGGPCMPSREVRPRAGCGKSARPVR